MATDPLEVLCCLPRFPLGVRISEIAADCGAGWEGTCLWEARQAPSEEKGEQGGRVQGRAVLATDRRPLMEEERAAMVVEETGCTFPLPLALRSASAFPLCADSSRGIPLDPAPTKRAFPYRVPEQGSLSCES